MKNRVFLFLLCVFFITAQAPGFAGIDERIQDADELFHTGGLDNYKKAIETYESVLSQAPENFEAHWKIARALREYGEEHMRLGVDGYSEACGKYGDRAMEYAEKAIALQPERVEGYLFYGMSVGTYSEGVGLVTALRQGLKNKTQSNLENAYEIDRNFDGGIPIMVLGRFWQVVPWPYTDRNKAESLYLEFQETEAYEQNMEGRIFMAELLSRKRGRGNKEAARQLLEEAIQLDGHEYWRAKAKEMLGDL